ITEIGPSRFACVVSDNAGNTRAARNLLAQQYPWLITLVDACHQQNNTAKDIGNLPHFRTCSSQLRSIASFFHSSTYAKRHLAALCVRHHVPGAISTIGNTRFATYYYSGQSTLRCLPLILELLSSGGSSIYWMLNRATVQQFTEELRQFVTVLEPLARSIKCLESSHSTAGDVYHFWLAVLARYHEIFTANNTLQGVGLPESVIEDIKSIVNGRHAEMFQGESQQVYLAAFFLDFRMFRFLTFLVDDLVY
ncbi:hypothetical protein BDV93DRAFT_461223, partial [Ceratobasidium sp. AG-I]